MVEFKDVQIKYDNFIAIDNLNLSINEGEFFTFLGPSGCGKTTTLRSLVGFLTPAKGEILVDNKVMNNVPIEKRGIGIVFQSYALFPSMTVYENIAFGLKVKKLSKEEIATRVKKVANTISISDEQLEKNVSDLSGGQQQRVALARAIILQPKILCLDEPLSNLDAKLRVDLRAELKHLQQNLGITTLYVTHDQEEALALSDRIAVFNNGFIEQVGTPYEIYSHSATEFVCDFIGDINRLSLETIKKINMQNEYKLDENKEGFIRIECIETVPSPENSTKLVGKIAEVEYNGSFYKYTFNVNGQLLKSIEKNYGMTKFKEGEEVSIYLNSRKIMQF